MRHHRGMGAALAVAVAVLAAAGCSSDSDPDPATPVQDVQAGEDGDRTDGGQRDGNRTDGSAMPVLDQPTVALETVATGLVSPVAMAAVPDGSGRLFVVDQIGLIRVITPDGELLDEPFLDVRDQTVTLDEAYDERGLLGMAFHPDCADNGRFFLYYSAPQRPGAPQEWDNTSHVAEYRVSTDELRADPSSERVLMRIDQPQSNHAGGTLAFGPDGHLYVSLGDGGAANDVGVGHPIPGNGQDTSTLLGSILRIDVDGEDPYGIPPDNPYAAGAGADEIFAYGFRNPYRFSFDLEGGNELYVGDAGQNLFEEISVVEPGGNYGWRIMEGTHCFDLDDPDQPKEACPEVGPDGQPLLPPVVEYTHDEVGMVVVGGYVYRGNSLPELDGVYVFGDWSATTERPSGTLLAAAPAGEGLWPWQRVRVANTPDGELGHFLLGFGQDADGELYALVKDQVGPVGNTGQVLRMVAP